MNDSKNRFQLHLQSFLWGVLLPLLGFAALASQVWQQGKGFVWDIPLLQTIHLTAQPVLDILAHNLTELGVFWGVFPVLSGVGCVLLYRRKWRSLIYLIATPIGSAIINQFSKLIFQRSRPDLWEMLTANLTYAFPSGHAMSSMSFVMVLIALAWNTRWRWIAVVLGSLFVLLIGWTRLYLGVHYPSDVLAGWLLAIAWSVGMMLVVQPQTIVNSAQSQFATELVKTSLAKTSKLN